MIQTLRREAQAAGSLKSNKQQSVVTENQGGSDVVVIQDADPGMVYVPAYDPGAVYEPGSGALAAGLLTFGLGVATAAIINDNYWNWNAGWAYPGRWAGYPGYRPFNGANARVAKVDVNNRWRPDPLRFHPSPRVQRALGNTPAGIARQGGAAQGGAAQGGAATLPRAGLAGPRTALRPAARAARRPAARPRRSRVSHLSRRRVRAGPRLHAGRRFRGGVRRFGGGARRFRGGVHRFGGGARRFGGGARRLGGAVRRPIRRR